MAFRALCGLVVVVVAVAGCADPPSATSAVIITLDTTRADALGCLGGQSGLTPYLDGLALESVLYERARTVAPLTMPAHASMFTGLYPPRHLVRDNNVQPVPAQAETLAERARAAGMQTAAFVSSPAVDQAFGFGQGFDVYDQPPRPLASFSSHYSERSSIEVVQAATKWLTARDRERPFLMWVHFFDPHAPYAPHGSFKARAGGDAYLGEVAAVDTSVGNLLAALRMTDAWDDTLVVVVGDHGEARGDHDEDTHGAYCYDSTMRVPFLVRHPDEHRAGETSQESVSVTDVYPTVLECLDLGSPGDIDGSSLRDPVPDERGVYFESYYGFIAYGWSPLAGWADRDGVYLHAPQPIYFDAADTAGPGRPPAAGEEGRMEAYRRAISDVFSRPALEPSRELADESMLEHLRAIGYAALASAPPDMPHPLKDGGRLDPHDHKRDHDRTVQALSLASEDPTKAYPILRQLIQANPKNVVALERLCTSLMNERRYAEALPPLRQLLASGPPWAGVHYSLGAALLNTGERAEALDHFRAAVVCDPGHVQSLTYLTLLLKEDKEFLEANRYHQLIERAGAAEEVKAYLESLRRGELPGGGG